MKQRQFAIDMIKRWLDITVKGKEMSCIKFLLLAIESKSWAYTILSSCHRSWSAVIVSSLFNNAENEEKSKLTQVKPTLYILVTCWKIECKEQIFWFLVKIKPSKYEQDYMNTVTP